MTGKIDPTTGQTAYGLRKVKTLCRLIEHDEASREEALAVAKVPKRTFYNWLDKFPEIADQIEMAERRRDYAIQRRIPDVKWRLERLSPKRYGRESLETVQRIEEENPVAEDMKLVREYEAYKIEEDKMIAEAEELEKYIIRDVVDSDEGM